MEVNFDSKPFYGNDGNKYIKTKANIFKDRVLHIFITKVKKYPKKMYHINVYQ